MADTALPTMAEVLAIEDSEELLARSCARTGIPLWALIRTPVLRQILSTLIYNDTPFDQRTFVPRAVVARTLARSVAHNAMRRGVDGDVCFMTSSLGLVARDGLQFDRLSGYFANCASERSFVWEDQHEWRWMPRRAFDRVVFHGPLQLAGAVLGRLKVNAADRRIARDFMGAVAQRVRDRLDLGIEVGALASSLARRIAAAPFLFDAYAHQLRRRGVRLLFKEDGCYSSSAIVLAAAHGQGIETAEFQHGALSAAHDAYNVAPAVAASAAFRESLPRHFLGYGQWWNDQMSVPVNKLAVGNPHRDETLRARAPSSAQADRLLVLGDGIETERYLDFLRAIAPAARASGLRPVFRPHPLERPRVAGMATDPAFDVDTLGDIYSAFGHAAIVVSEISTGLFEAIGLVEHIVIWNTPKAVFNFPEHPFQAVEGAAELSDLLQFGGLRRIGTCEANGIWAPSWRSNYLDFLNATIGGALPVPRQTA